MIAEHRRVSGESLVLLPGSEPALADAGDVSPLPSLSRVSTRPARPSAPGSARPRNGAVTGDARIAVPSPPKITATIRGLLTLQAG